VLHGCKQAFLIPACAGIIPDLCRDCDISGATFYKLRARYGGMYATMMKRMKELEADSSHLKKMYA